MVKEFIPIESQELSKVERLEQRPFWKRLLLSYRDLLQSYGELQSMYEELKYEAEKKYIPKDKHLEKMENLNKIIKRQAESNRQLNQMLLETGSNGLHNNTEWLNRNKNLKATNHTLRERVSVFESIVSYYNRDLLNKIRKSSNEEIYLLFGYDKSKWEQ